MEDVFGCSAKWQGWSDPPPFFVVCGGRDLAAVVGVSRDLAAVVVVVGGSRDLAAVVGALQLFRILRLQ